LAISSETVMKAGEAATRTPLLDNAKYNFFVLLASLPLMKWGLPINGLVAFPADLLFVITTMLWVAAIALGQARLHLDRSFLLLAAYFAAMAVSAVFSVNPSVSAFKLLTQVYLLLLPVLAFNLVRTEADLRRAFAWWLVPAVAISAYGVGTLVLFPFFGWHSFLREPLHEFGTLAPGPYPRIGLTFGFASMLANYLGVSLMLMMLARSSRWIGSRTSIVCAAAMLLSAFFALTPGFGGVLAMLAAWVWYRERQRRPLLALLALAASIVLIPLEVLVAAITPFIYPTAPYVIQVQGLGVSVAPAIRLLVWESSANTFLASPLVGHGIGVNPASVFYQSLEQTTPGYVTDAHNFILSIAAQCGILGVAALVAIVWYVADCARKAARAGADGRLLFGLSIAWLAGFVVEGLVGSFEDARHLWLLFGLIAAANRIRPPIPARRVEVVQCAPGGGRSRTRTVDARGGPIRSHPPSRTA
jgi:O-antigen ligase